MDVDVAAAPPPAPSFPAAQLTPSKKRNHEGEIVNHPVFLTSPAGLQSSPLTADDSRCGTPNFSARSTPLTELGATPVLSPAQPSTMAPANGKKRKATFAEKEADKAIKLAEKEEKERLKAEAKAKKDEEKKRKEDEKDAARKVREEKKQEKEAEKQRKEAEALKKERSQMRLGAFFAPPPVASTPPASDLRDASRGTTPSRRGSITSVDLEPPLDEIKASPSKRTNSGYNEWILPFFVKEYMEVAPFNRFLSNRTVFDKDVLAFNQGVTSEKLRNRFRRRPRVRPVKPVKEILDEMSGPETAPIDLANPANILADLPYKYLFFHEDVRPPYHGTYTRVVSPRSTRKLAINSAHRGLPDTNYDYDSEAEWQEPEEGDEEVLEDDEKSEDEDGDEEMGDFLDDEGEVAKRQLIVGNMEPKCSGLCWEGGDSQPQDGFDLSSFRMDVLHDSTVFPIDPYSTMHWADMGKKSPVKREEKLQTLSMQPPRLPLVAVDPNTSVSQSGLLKFAPSDRQLENQGQTSKLKATTASGKPVKTISPDLMPAFREAVSGTTLTKTGLIEVLKNQFPKCAKDAIKNTLEAIAERREKKWVLIG
ncbi:uncharacterized protein Z520_11830 [Fonsecaea multimorphosa CBS 102226]|uniref:Chromatin assembly factor 1 subunit A n=1 Tax=Fonsecaea multimorphosa CBS 102226 TaxID=1442371 RepID=A0A0D2GSR8_9EURO|nr:uncharacterized protein Z520_11830 [Fonsecaea multimorphosa CBS 102226]KIX92510.1 hypothetical protein Z520_11830 [Fonsecaea multimorphosa CBS 102226]OAL19623.1 hypothetical protein AYO22_09785 [Fonsecaea multimorphosa]